MSALGDKDAEMAYILANMKGEDEETVISTSGDTIAHVGSKPCQHLVVSSDVIKAASPIFAIMVTKARMRQSYEDTDLLHTHFKFDNPFILKVLFSVLHGIEMFKAYDWDVDTVWKLIRVAQNYHCAPLFLSFVEGLSPIFTPLWKIITPGTEGINPVDRFEAQMKLVAICIAVDSDVVFWHVTRAMVKEYVQEVAEEVGLDWSIVHHNVYRDVYDCIQDLSEVFKCDLQEGMSDAEELIKSIAEQFDEAASRCPHSFITCFHHALQATGQAPSSATMHEVRSVVKKYCKSLDKVCKSGCASCDALDEVKVHLQSVLNSTKLDGLSLSEFMEYVPEARRCIQDHCCDEVECDM
ncbi:hypothetical protein PVAR5_5408 [Paecilomyces variotii No. 5]|uniref:Uncharacterized protein n=1 Tax=Byssochlamys spectabilis (strain No. 5 / NBRC 109023) TaxID=1356009 RepID=V5FXC1_BYSSN|nr:hypothetical protein PVAR5_5408 [Paecilomyces variotii No. 5]